MTNYSVEKFKGVNGHYCANIYVEGTLAKRITESSAKECVVKVDRFVGEIECGTWKNYLTPFELKVYEMLKNK